MSATFTRRVYFEKGYNYLHETGPNRRGQHGMQIRFVFTGPHGATQFLMYTNWSPLGPVDVGSPESCHVDYHEQSVIHGSYGLVRPPMGADIGHHWRKPTWEGEATYKCSFLEDLDGGECYYDGSGLAASHLLRDFIIGGEVVVWRRLIEVYRECLEAAARVEAEVNA